MILEKGIFVCLIRKCKSIRSLMREGKGGSCNSGMRIGGNIHQRLY